MTKKRTTKKRTTKKLTLTDVGHVSDKSRFRLDPNYANTKKQFKVIEDHVLGYAIWGDGHRAPLVVRPILRATIYLTTYTQNHNEIQHVISSTAMGEPLNGDYGTDIVGASLAGAMHCASLGLLSRAKPKR